ncbi:hypothetical protein V8G54_031563 [Vigna mungo]|uniref:Uncharacterized protein n=1 Tax=Vigna mungo TaxID=3915 RepID=A0AAQ3MKC8_VIGMU
MVDPSTPSPSESEDQSQSSTQPKCRRATRLTDLTISRSVDQRLPIQFDMSTGKVLRDNRARFTSFVTLLGISKVLRNEFKKELFPKLRDELLSEIKSEIASLGLTIQGPPKGAPPIGASTKGSCPLP